MVRSQRVGWRSGGNRGRRISEFRVSKVVAVVTVLEGVIAVTLGS